MGIGEGCLYLDRLANAAEAVAIRETLVIRKQKAVTAETKARLRSPLVTSRSLRNRPNSISLCGAGLHAINRSDR